MADNDAASEYGHFKAKADPSSNYLWPPIVEIAKGKSFPSMRSVDVGCGTGGTTDFIRQQGFEALGLEPSPKGVAMAQEAYPEVRYEVANAYDDLAAAYGQFGLVTSFEVVEHMYEPQKLIRTLFGLTQPGGYCLISTPYHGYWKNLMLAVLGKWDHHLQPHAVGGHIKFFTIPQLSSVMEKEGFVVEKSWRVGRGLPALAKSMVILGRRPA